MYIRIQRHYDTEAELDLASTHMVRIAVATDAKMGAIHGNDEIKYLECTYTVPDERVSAFIWVVDGLENFVVVDSWPEPKPPESKPKPPSGIAGGLDLKMVANIVRVAVAAKKVFT